MAEEKPKSNAAPEKAPAEAVSRYTAVIHCHGMGSQRRYEEVSRLIDSLDRYSRTAGSMRMLDITPYSEPSRAEEHRILDYVRCALRDLGAGSRAKSRELRFYEIYWAPVMAGQKSVVRVLRWLFAQVLRPWNTVGTHWRERQRLRRAVLAAMFEAGATPPAGAEPGDFETLLRAYHDYEGLPAQRKRAEGDFSGFLTSLGGGTRKPEDAERLQRIARAWWWRYLGDECRNAFALATAALGMVLGFLAAAWLVLVLLQWATGNETLKPLIALLPDKLDANWATAISLAFSVIVLKGLGGFIADSLGDVEAWSTYRETDEKHEIRRKILTEAMNTIAHVLGDPKCERVVLVSHSLGTTIAHDSLLALARVNRAADPHDHIKGPTDLRKIEHFVTMGSPIDKVEYFFESYSSQSHRYKRVTEELRGDIGTVPFCRNRHPHIHWVNFWDEGDPVSGALQSPTNAERVANRVDNVHVRNWPFPDPGASHLGYVDNRTVIAALFEMIDGRTGSYAALKPVPGKGKDYASVALGPGMKRGWHRPLVVVAMLLPWVALAGLAAGLWGAVPLWQAMLPAGVGAGMLALGYITAKARGHADAV